MSLSIDRPLADLEQRQGVAELELSILRVEGQLARHILIGERMVAAGENASRTRAVLRRLTEHHLALLRTQRRHLLESASGGTVEEREVERTLVAEGRRLGAELRATLGALDHSNPTLRGSRDDIALVNEELQLLGEELEVSKEELRFLNGELAEVNHQLQVKIDELERTTDTLSNLLGSTQIATVFLDRQLCVRWFTPSVRRLIGLIDRDIGRPIHDFVLKFHDPTLLRDAEAVLATLVLAERDVPGHDGRWYARRVLPYRTHGDRVDGIVLTFDEITERRRSEERIRDLANHDPLTGLPNRRLFQDRLQGALASSQRAGDLGALVLLDLDRFKAINDNHGHGAGDALLGKVARDLCSCLRATDTVARLGGDEFGLVLGGLGDSGAVEAIMRKIASALGQPLVVDRQEIRVGASAGITLFPHDGSKIDELLTNADLALYRAKKAGPGSWCFFDAGMRAQIELRRTQEAALRQGLAQDELMLLYQPVVALATGDLVAFEALIRWRQPDGRLVLPAEFLPVAEETDLGVEIGAFALRRAARDLSRWLSAGLAVGRVAVNLAAVQLVRADLVETVEAALAGTGLAPGQLEVEVTEGVILGPGAEAVARTLGRLHRLGVTISLDDFGTGHASLVHLRRLPVDRIKIDRSFVAGMLEDTGNGAIVRGVIGLAHSLGITVVAEGVETEAQVAFLRQHGCDHAQGYLFAPPIEAGRAGVWAGHGLSG